VRGYSLLELLVVVFIISLLITLVLPARSPSWEREAVYQQLVRARWASVFSRKKVEIRCFGNELQAMETLSLRVCSVSCNAVVFHPSGYVTPAGSLILRCGNRRWRFVISALGRIRVLKFGAQEAVGN